MFCRLLAVDNAEMNMSKANVPVCLGHPSAVKCKLRFFENVLDLNNIIKKAAGVIEVDLQQLQ